MEKLVRNAPRCNPDVLNRVRETAPRPHEVFKVSGKTYVARRIDSGVVIVPSNFKAMTYAVSSEDGQECIAEFIHVE